MVIIGYNAKAPDTVIVPLSSSPALGAALGVVVPQALSTSAMPTQRRTNHVRIPISFPSRLYYDYSYCICRYCDMRIDELISV
jgi:hypothetical protein